MSPLAQAAAISGGIFAMVMLRGYGRRAFDRHAVLLPIAMVGGFGYAYLRHAPTSSAGDWIVYAAGLVVGLGFGWVATAVTGLERDRATGIVQTITGPAFALVWAAAVLIRLAFIWALTYWEPARDHIGRFLFDHQISTDAIAPFFLLWALAMVISRLAALKVREGSLTSPRRAPARPVAGRAR